MSNLFRRIFASSESKESEETFGHIPDTRSQTRTFDSSTELLPKDSDTMSSYSDDRTLYAPSIASTDTHLEKEANTAGSNSSQTTKNHKFPWSIHELVLAAPIPVPQRWSNAPENLLEMSPSPFPRHGHSVAGGEEIYLFGGLVKNEPRNDLYVLSPQKRSVSVISTVGDNPPPRYGHASALIGSVLIIWGGNTKNPNETRHGVDEELDNRLYLLNLVSKEWTCVRVTGAVPKGRYGHAACMIGPKFYILGGQTGDNACLHDVWMFDLNTLRVCATWEEITSANGPDSPLAPPRSGQVCVAWEQKIFLFGGTDTSFRYNDTWVFDTTTQTWSEMSCVGYIPQYRRGRAAALVGDVMYIYGGKDHTTGRCAGDLSALHIPLKRWFIFLNMGPAPFPRSGHCMVTVGMRVYVLGGVGDSELEESAVSDKSSAIDETNIHVLNTEHVHYHPGTTPSSAT